MLSVERVPVRFERPPVIEVACGVTFALPKPLKSAHVGLYWAKVRSQFPRAEDATPIPTVLETQGPAESTEMNVQFEAVQLPPMRRAWLIDAPGTHLVQLQDDRFLFNWKRTDQDESYPSYKKVIAGFWQQWAQYRNFLESEGLGTATPVQLELTYFNFWAGDFSFLRDLRRNDVEDRFLQEPAAATWKTVHHLPDSQGRLHVSAANARHNVTQERGIRMDLTARGMPRDTSSAGCEQWFDLAHEWITHGFADLTTPEAHKLWRRTA